MNQHLAIVFEDDHCLALAKPPGQFSQGNWRPAGDTTLETAVRRYLDPADPGSAYLGIVHRLDRPSSGLLLWAKTPKAARRLSAQFERRAVVKEYWAVVELGEAATTPELGAGSGPEPFAGDSPSLRVWSDWLTRANDLGIVSAVAPHTPGAREAVTQWQRAAAESLPARCAWLRLWPHTGRTHQLRIQTARRGMPILGDSSYGATLAFPVPHAIALHARSLRFHHPVTGVAMALVAPLPSSWAAGGLKIVPE